jgi:hypothetical protein
MIFNILPRLDRIDTQQANAVHRNLVEEMRSAIMEEPMREVRDYSLGTELFVPAFDMVQNQWHASAGVLCELLQLVARAAKGDDMQGEAALWLDLRIQQYANDQINDAMFVIGVGE